jgi:hypothetical protein
MSLHENLHQAIEEPRIGPPGYVFDPQTGEVKASAEQVDQIAGDFVSVSRAIDEAEAELKLMRTRREELGIALRDLVPTEGRADAGDAWLVRSPAPRPAQRVSRTGAERHAEPLLGLGLGRMAYAPPGIAEVRRERARIIAAGIPLEEIAPEPLPGPDTFEIVPKGGA